jgi:acyl carrier protein
MENLILKLKKEIIGILNREDITPEDIDAEAPLFGDGLGLDSIDALEFLVLLEETYGIKIEDPKKGRKIFYSVKTMADYIQEHQKN